MRIFFIASVATVAFVVCYAASPILSAWNLKQAIKAADTPVIAKMVDWPGVRATLKASISRDNELAPAAAAAMRRVRPSFWQRLRYVLGESMLDGFINRYVTPEGLPRLFKFNKTWNTQVRGRVQRDKLPVQERLLSFLKRIKRAEFVNPLRFELEMEDRYKATRRIVTTFALTNLSLSGFEWKLIALKIKKLNSRAANLARLNGFKRQKSVMARLFGF